MIKETEALLADPVLQPKQEKAPAAPPAAPSRPDDALQGIFEGLVGIGTAPKPLTSKQQEIKLSWEKAVQQARQRAEQIREFGQTITKTTERFQAVLLRATAAIDKYRETYTRAFSGSLAMQGRLEEWMKEQEVRHKQDLAFAVATLVWGVGALTARGVQALRAAGKVAEAERMAAQGAKLAEQVTGYTLESAALHRYPRTMIYVVQQARADATHFARLCREAGKDTQQVLAQYGGDMVQAAEALVWELVRQRGWHIIHPNVAGPLSELAMTLRTAVSRGGALSPEGVARLRKFVTDYPGLWERSLATGAEIVAEGKDISMIVKLFGPKDVALFKKFVEAGYDVNALRVALGPKGLAALESAPLVIGAADPLPIIGGMGLVVPQGAPPAADGAASTGLQDMRRFRDAFGITDRSYLGALGSSLWGLLTSPFMTYAKIKGSIEMLGLTEEFMKAHGQDLVTIAQMILSAARALSDAALEVERAQLVPRLEEYRRQLQVEIATLAPVSDFLGLNLLSASIIAGILGPGSRFAKSWEPTQACATGNLSAWPPSHTPSPPQARLT